MTDVQTVDLDSLNYVVKVPYNGTGPMGGNPLEDNMNIWYEVSLRRQSAIGQRWGKGGMEREREREREMESKVMEHSC